MVTATTGIDLSKIYANVKCVETYSYSDSEINASAFKGSYYWVCDDPEDLHVLIYTRNGFYARVPIPMYVFKKPTKRSQRLPGNVLVLHEWGRTASYSHNISGTTLTTLTWDTTSGTYATIGD